MSPKQVQNNFIEFYGKEKYIEFVLSLYEAFPLRDELFFWQEKLLNNFSEHFRLPKIGIKTVHSNFNCCPLHNTELEKDIVPIVDGNGYQPVLPYSEGVKVFPMANLDAPRNLEMFSYPEKVDVFYCSNCRKERITIAQRIKH